MKSISAINDTITAIATPVGGAIAVLRLSGPQSIAIAEKVWCGPLPLSRLPSRKMHLGEALGKDNAALDHCMAVRFTAPASYTGEEMVEIHTHGGGLVARQILLCLLAGGARHAEPGEFTRRAFLNGKMDLTQAEAVADIIEAHSVMALRLAKRQLDGILGRNIADLYDRLNLLLADIESQLDFPEEEIERTPGPELAVIIEQAQQDVGQLLNSRLEGEVLRHGIRLVLAGPPNVGKSSLMNSILGRDRAIVTDVPGTTRDTLEEFAHIRAIPIRLIDTAGIREAKDTVETAGIERTLASMQEAQVILWITDASVSGREQAMPADFARHPVIKVENKCDQLPEESPPPDPESVQISALTGFGMEKLFDAIEQKVWQHPHRDELEIAVSARHADLLSKALPALIETEQSLQQDQFELAAVSLRSVLESIGQITGRTVVPDVLDTIFSRFCIGK